MYSYIHTVYYFKMLVVLLGHRKENTFSVSLKAVLGVYINHINEAFVAQKIHHNNVAVVYFFTF